MPSKRKPKDDEVSVTSESKIPVKNVPALMGEGEKFFRDQLYSKAIECYTEALELGPGNKTALVERAACYLKIGKNDLALADAEESLKENKEFTKGLYEKAEALYAMGEFELALVFYHRGKKLRGDVKEFQLGINKAQEAIDNCVGDPHSVKLEVKGDLSYFEKSDEKQKKQFKMGGYSNPFAKKQTIVQKREKRAAKPGSQKTVKQLLGELYADKVYLEKLLEDDHVTRVNTKSGDAIWTLANNGLDFLDSRTEFWGQQKPTYARKSSYGSSNSDSKNPLNYVLKKLEAIDNLQTNGKYAESLDKSNRLLSYVNPLNLKQLSGKKELLAQIYSNIGNAHLELGQYDQALQAHQKDLDISKESDNKEGISRSYENIGRVYARNGKYKDAIAVWEKKLPLAENDMEKAWLYHEIGRCHLEMGNYQVSKDYGEKSLACAETIKDEVWQLNATVLIAQSEVKIGDADSLNKAIDNFENALKMTQKQNDTTAGNAIKKALEDCKQKLKKLQISPQEEPKSESPKPEVPPKRPETPVKPKEEVKKSPTPEPTPEPLDKEIQSQTKPESPTEAKAPTPVPENKNPVDYEIEVKTSDEVNSGTDGEVSISLFGENGDITNMPLSKSLNNKNAFEKNGLDVFTFSGKNIGKITKINLALVVKGAGDSWKVETVNIIVEKNVYVFNTNRWLDKDKTNCDFQLTSSKSGIQRYKVEVKTSDESGAGTDSKVMLSIYGTNQNIIDSVLSKSLTHKDPFEENHTDIFSIEETIDVGKITKINIGHDGKGLGTAWKLDYVKINYNAETYIFNANRWLDKSKGDSMIRIDLEPASGNI